MPDTIQPIAEPAGHGKPIEIEDIGSNPAPRETIGELMERRLSRRAAMLGLGGAAAAATLVDQMVASADGALAQGIVPMTDGPSTLGFAEIRHGMAQRDAVAEGYEIQTVIRWGDAVVGEAPAFNPLAQTPAAQEAQRGQWRPFARQVGTADRRHRVMRQGLLRAFQEIRIGPHLLGPPGAVLQRCGAAAEDFSHPVGAAHRGHHRP